MSNEYLDTYYATISDVSDPDNPEVVEMATVRAVSFDDARSRVLRSMSDEDARERHIEVKRWKHPRLVASPSDIERERRRKMRQRKRAPQFNAKRRSGNA